MEEYFKELRCATFEATDDIDADYSCFINTLKNCAKAAETQTPVVNRSHISEEIKQLMQRSKFKHDGNHNVEYFLV